MNADPRLGLRANLGQFCLLVLVNAFVGAMIGMERSILPSIAEQEFHLVARSAILSFILVFGLSKALSNYAAGHLSDRFGRRNVLIAGWVIAAPVPFMLMWAPEWNWILAANILLGISQGLTWSTTVIMKIDLAGPKNRGLAMGLNEFAGYAAVAASAWVTGWLAAHYGLRPQPFYPGIAFVVLGLGLSVLAVRDTRQFVQLETGADVDGGNGADLAPREIFLRTSFQDRNLSSISAAGFANNLNDAMAWGIFPLFYAAAGMSLAKIGLLVALYPMVWGSGQLLTGPLSDRVGRKWLIVAGMWVQAVGIGTTIVAGGIAGFALGAIMLGAGTAMVYPTAMAAIGDAAEPAWRASAVGIYRFWRDLGYVAGALIAGFSADAIGLDGAMWLVAALTIGAGLIVASRLSEKQMFRPKVV